MAHVHLVGIGGSGLSAIARILLERGEVVSGSDLESSSFAREIEELGAKVMIGHRADYILGADLVIRSSAIPDNNVEIQAALEAEIPIYKRADYLGELMAGKKGIAVAGTHGKTTTTAMISWMLTSLEQDPSYIIGGVSKNLGQNAHAGGGELFVIEADEYDYMFLGLQPQIAIVTNIEHDHPDVYPTEEVFFQAFIDFANRIKDGGVLIACQDDYGAAKLVDMTVGFGFSCYSYGLGSMSPYETPDYSVQNLTLTSENIYVFDALFRGGHLTEVSISLPGIHNVRNAIAAIAVAHQLDLPTTDAAQALMEYQGTERRFEVRGEFSGIEVIDDYAHHPTEIKATLAAARSRFPGRKLWAVWQPHTYSRTSALFDDFLTAFEDADHVLITEIFASRETPDQNESSLQIVHAMNHPDVLYMASNGQVVEYLMGNLKHGDVLMVLSAGDAIQISEEVIRLLSMNGNGKWQK
jgi:UDP-N-acetylmuramate--alanine ligase